MKKSRISQAVQYIAAAFFITLGLQSPAFGKTFECNNVWFDIPIEDMDGNTRQAQITLADFTLDKTPGMLTRSQACIAIGFKNHFGPYVDGKITDRWMDTLQLSPSERAWFCDTYDEDHPDVRYRRQFLVQGWVKKVSNNNKWEGMKQTKLHMSEAGCEAVMDAYDLVLNPPPPPPPACPYCLYKQDQTYFGCFDKGSKVDRMIGQAACEARTTGYFFEGVSVDTTVPIKRPNRPVVPIERSTDR